MTDNNKEGIRNRKPAADKKQKKKTTKEKEEEVRRTRSEGAKRTDQKVTGDDPSKHRRPKDEQRTQHKRHHIPQTNELNCSLEEEEEGERQETSPRPETQKKKKRGSKETKKTKKKKASEPKHASPSRLMTLGELPLETTNPPALVTARIVPEPANEEQVTKKDEEPEAVEVVPAAAVLPKAHVVVTNDNWKRQRAILVGLCVVLAISAVVGIFLAIRRRPKELSATPSPSLQRPRTTAL